MSSPIWTAKTACQIAADAGWKFGPSCQPTGSDSSEPSLPDVQNISSYLVESPTFGNGKQSIAPTLMLAGRSGVKADDTSVEMVRDRYRQLWNATKHPPEGFRDYGYSFEYYEEYPFYGVTSPTLQVVDTCFGAEPLEHDRTSSEWKNGRQMGRTNAELKPFTHQAWSTYVKLFNPQPLFTRAIDYKELSPVEINFLTYILRESALDQSNTKDDLRTDIKLEAKSRSKKLIDQLTGRETQSDLVESEVFNRLFPMVDSCYRSDENEVREGSATSDNVNIRCEVRTVRGNLAQKESFIGMYNELPRVLEYVGTSQDDVKWRRLMRVALAVYHRTSRIADLDFFQK
jgi:hypothetical protein